MRFPKRKNRLPRQLGHALLEDAMGRAQTQETRSEGEGAGFAGQCERVRSPQGRKAHYRHPRHPERVLCGWPGEWVDAGDSLPTCLMCADELERLSGEGAA